MSQAIYQLSDSNKNPVNYFRNVESSINPYGGVNIEDTLYDYKDVAKRVAEFIRFNGRAPSCAGSDVGDIHYVELIDAFSCILKFYNENARLPSQVSINHPY